MNMKFNIIILITVPVVNIFPMVFVVLAWRYCLIFSDVYVSTPFVEEDNPVFSMPSLHTSFFPEPIRLSSDLVHPTKDRPRHPKTHSSSRRSVFTCKAFLASGHEVEQDRNLPNLPPVTLQRHEDDRGRATGSTPLQRCVLLQQNLQETLKITHFVIFWFST